MSDYMYDPSDVGKEVQSSRGTWSKVRKYHLTPEEMDKQRLEWEKSIKRVPVAIKQMAHPTFFNPYRKGIYWGQVQALYLLGSNQWHTLDKIMKKTREVLMKIPVYYKDKRSGVGVQTNVWDRFASKTPKSDARRSKDILGRVQENMLFFQRLSRLHPCGFKLRQARAAIDYKKVTSTDYPSGELQYKLHTYSTEQEALPSRDFSEFKFEGNEKKHISYLFLGKIITCDKVFIGGKECSTV